MAKSIKTPTPLKILNEYKNKYPDLFRIIDSVHRDRGNRIPDWDERCYAPIALTLSLQEHYGAKDIDNSFPHTVSALAGWRQYKQIYRFDRTLYEELTKAEVDTILPVELLNNLPYNCFYIEIEQDGIDGYFVFYDDDCRNSESSIELRITIVFDNLPTFGLYVPLIKGKSIFESLTSIKEKDKFYIISALSQMRSDSPLAEEERIAIEKPDYILREYASLMSKFMQPIYYICSINADIKENPVFKETHRPINENNIKDKFSEIQKWDVGFKISKMLSNVRNNSESISDKNTDSGKSGTGSRKRPHTRKAHFHHYWVGGKDSRKLVLKWVSAMFINADDDNDNIIATINQIE